MTIRVTTRRCALLLLIPCAACSGSDAAAGGAGIDARIDTLASGTVRVRNGGSPTWTVESAWTLVEDLRLGSVAGEGPELFAQVAAILTDDEDRVYVLDYPTQEIRVFSATGDFLHRIGGPGQGPGELSDAAGLNWAPDGRLWVWGGSHYYVLEPTGEEVARYPRRVRGVIYSWQGGFDASGRYVDWGLDREMLGTTQQGQLIMPNYSGRTMFYPVVFTPPARFDTLPLLEFHAEVTEAGALKVGRKSMEAQLLGDDVWFVHTDDYTVYRRTLDGDTTLLFTLPATPMRIPDDEIEAQVAQSAGRPGPPLTRDDFVPFRPVVTKVIPDGAGHVYVFPQEEGLPQGAAVDVFEESGRYLGRMRLPAPILVDRPAPFIVRDHLYAVEPDPFDVPFVVRYRIVRPEEG
jgi:hypothetical protein